MKSQKIILILIVSILILSLYRCKTEEIILHGEISGIVTDTTTGQLLQAVAVKLNPVNDTTSTGSDGKYLFKSLIPGDYDIEVSKPPYATGVRTAIVTSANTTPIDFALNQIAYPEFSERHLDFGFDSIQKSFTITNTGIGELNYSITTSQDWITVDPNIGEITTEPQKINVTIDRTGLSEKKHIESVEVVSHVGIDLVRDTVYVLLNGIMDQDYNYYGIVTIGTQTWLSDNINTGKAIPISQVSTNNGIIEKWCYDCKTYGGLYTWWEAMQYNPPDSELVIRPPTRGICPVGWHIPNYKEWSTLYDYVGHDDGGNKLRETGTMHWNSPNTGATNETGFTALPGGQALRTPDWCSTDPSINQFCCQGEFAGFWGTWLYVFASCNYYTSYVGAYSVRGNNTAGPSTYTSYTGASVRCIKDPAK